MQQTNVIQFWNIKPKLAWIIYIYIYIYIHIKLKNLFKACIKKWVKPRNTLYLNKYTLFILCYIYIYNIIYVIIIYCNIIYIYIYICVFVLVLSKFIFTSFCSLFDNFWVSGFGLHLTRTHFSVIASVFTFSYDKNIRATSTWYNHSFLISLPNLPQYPCNHILVCLCVILCVSASRQRRQFEFFGLNLPKKWV